MIASCACGSVELQASGTPIVGVVCYCDDCQEGGRRIEALAKAGPVQDPDGGTAYLLYRKDRLECVKGAPLLKEPQAQGEVGHQPRRRHLLQLGHGPQLR